MNRLISQITDQTEAGVSLRIRDNDGLSPDVLDAFLASVKITGKGTVDVSPADDGACATAQQAQWKTDELWCKE